jgi:hypothetical protein
VCSFSDGLQCLYSLQGTHGGVYIENVTECFPEKETRVLTNRGFLYLDEIEECESQGVEMQYACYDRTTKGIVYSRGVLVKPTKVPTHLVDFTQRNTRAHWDAGSDDYGVTSSAEANHLSLLVTPNHRMYVQVGERMAPADAGHRHSVNLRSNEGVDIDFQTISAEELTAGFDCSCPTDNIPGCRLAEKPCMHFRNETSAVRFLGHADGGFAGAGNLPDLPVSGAGDQLAAFLRLYGQSQQRN